MDIENKIIVLYIVYVNINKTFETRWRVDWGHRISPCKYTISLKMNSHLVEFIHIIHLNKI